MNTLRKIVTYVGTFGESLDKVAQMAHALAGFAMAREFGLPGALVILLAWGVPKEFYIDVKYEGASYRGGLKDWAFYALGAALGLLLHHLATR